MSAQNGTWRRSCGCMRTSDKLKQILKEFPEPPPPSPRIISPVALGRNTIVSEMDNELKTAYPISAVFLQDITHNTRKMEKQLKSSYSTKNGYRTWDIVVELMSLIQLAIMATVLAVYYMVYCYMQLIYFTLRSAVYFHYSDGPMKITIAIVAATSLLVGYQIFMRTERLLGLK